MNSLQEHHSEAHKASHHSDAEHVAASVWKYKLLFFGLLFLTLVTVGLSYVDFGSHFWNFVVGLFVATVKAGLVAAIFMHLWGEKVTVWRFLVLTCIFVAGLFALSLLAHNDPIPSTASSSHSSKGWVGVHSMSGEPHEGSPKEGH